jgi:hypothetical protein
VSGAALASQFFMRVAIFSTKHYDRIFLEAANTTYGHELVFFEPRLTEETAPLAAQFPAVCVFVNDQLSGRIRSSGMTFSLVCSPFQMSSSPGIRASSPKTR